MLRVLLAGGGTAGHINPALAIAEIIKSKYPDAEFCFAGNPTKLESKIVPQNGYPFEPFMIEGFQRKLSPENIKRNLKAAYYLSKSGKRAKEIINNFKPDLVIGTGGYVSGPIVRKAAQMGIKTAIHEANAFAGVTTKMLSKNVDVIMLTVAETKNLEADVMKKAVVTGLPVRKAFELKTKTAAKKELGFEQDDICILSSGGSLGSRVINENMARVFKWYQEKNIKVNHIHSYGTYKGYANYIKQLQNDGVKVKGNPHLIVKDYINMPLAMAAADLVITRCGASTLAELEAVGRGAILIPSPMVAENHQYHNGMVLQNAGAGFVFEEKNLQENTIINKLDELISNPEKMAELSANSAKLYIKDTNERILNALEPLIEK
ncbi:MAG: UDP-N-acetylglucosamine--N-acetylmuramyl-(pentapeptide) pyrophosphoryl-undecaprenol N-acetylglucosamine transferase [Oscillospiraceae bacterium]